MIKNFILDTCVLMSHPDAIYGFDDNNVIITCTTLEELNYLKDSSGEKAMQARSALRELKKLRLFAKEQGKRLSEGVPINHGHGLFRVENDCIDPSILPQGWDISLADNRIISAAKKLNAILITEDEGMSIKAQDIDVEVQSYKNAEIDIGDVYTGRGEIYLSQDDIGRFMKEGTFTLDPSIADTLTENEYLTIRNTDNPRCTVLARYKNKAIRKLCELSDSCKVKPRNAGQRFALDALLSPDIPLVILIGEAGTAKTFLSVAAGMDMLHEQYDAILATRNNAEFDKEIGALPGSEMEKVSPLLRGITDNLRTYLRINGTDKENLEQSVEDYLATDIHIESMGFMRGRSVTDTFMILDECQNATPLQVMGIVTRAGERSKIVICGDPNQIDRTVLTKATNGLTFAAHAMKGSPYCAQVWFKDSECERSVLAKDAAERMGRFLR